MDISTITAQNRVVELVHPATGENVGIRVELRPSSDPAVKRVKRKFLDQRLNGRKSKITAKLIDDNTTEIIIASMASWHWDEGVTFQGEVPELTPENVKAVFKHSPWVRDQLNEEAGDTEAFFES